MDAIRNLPAIVFWPLIVVWTAWMLFSLFG